MSTIALPLQLAPDNLYQPILPGWQLSLFSINLGESTNPEIEKAAIERIGSYGKQIGHLAEALEVVIERMKLLDADDLAPEQKDTLKVFLGDVATVRGIKREAAGTSVAETGA